MTNSDSRSDLKDERIVSEFSKNGFILLKNVFSEERCDQLRTQILNKFDELKAIDPQQIDHALTQSEVFSIQKFGIFWFLKKWCKP